MGTNYYWIEPESVCEHCGRGNGSEYHIGKSSAGWCFNLRIHPEHGITELGDWLERWDQKGSRIRNEYGDDVTINEMMHTILARWWSGDEWTPENLATNHAVRGPFGLAAPADCPIGRHGPYAINSREFS